ncbi:MAG: Ig-like domain-containing protein [Gemmatimonadales bacterium]
MRALISSSLRTGLAAVLALGCGGGGGDVTGPPADPRPVATVELSPNPASVAVGRTLQLAAVTKASDGSRLDGRAVAWSTSDPGVATVSANGEVTGVAAGDATITGRSEGVNGTAAVTVATTATGGMLRNWIGGAAGPTDWSVAPNWNPAGTPGSADTARLPAATNAPVLSGDVRIARLIVVGGRLRTAGHTLTIRQP